MLIMNYYPRLILEYLIGCLVLLCGHCQEKPNIVVIIADDMGWNDVGFHGSSQIQTPNIDALAYSGLILNSHYSQQTCTPSRAAFLTGNYAIRSGMQGIPIIAGESRSLPEDMPTMPEILKTLGYQNHLVGKWHLGHPYKNSTPTRRGFDSHYGYWNGFIGYFQHFAEGINSHNQNVEGLDMHEDFEPDWSQEGNYATEIFTRRATDIIQASQPGEPFLLVLSHLAPHTGRKGVELGVPDLAAARQRYSYIANPGRMLYADVVTQLDKSVGEVMTSLANKGVLDNTIVVFIADNGAQTIGLYQNFGSNWPLRGLKFTLFEGGVRTAAAVYHSKIKNKGGVSNSLFHISDWLPTLYAAAGGNVNDLGQIDGINQWDTLIQDAPTQRKNILLNIDEFENTSAYIGYNGRFKLVNGSYSNGIYDQHYGDSGQEFLTPPYNYSAVLESDTQKAIGDDPVLSSYSIAATRSAATIPKGCLNSIPSYDFTCPGFCLFDLVADPCETENVIDNYPGIAEELKQQLGSYWPKIRPQKEPVYVDPMANPVFCSNVWFNWLDAHWTSQCVR